MILLRRNKFVKLRKVAIVIGGSGGIRQTLCARLAREGAKVTRVISDRLKNTF